MENKLKNRERQHYDGEKDKKYIISSFKKCVTEKREIDKKFETIILPFIKSKKYNILDACCGIGYISYFLSKINPESKFLGIDQTPYLIDEAKKLCKNESNISFELNDIYNISKKYQKQFDVSINWRTLSWLPYYDQILENLFAVTKKHIFVSSLFYDGDIDFITQVREFKTETGEKKFNDYNNVYSLPHFKEFLYKLGAKNIEVYDFDIEIDIPKPPLDQLISYTEKLENGKRLQISGAMLLPWKIIRIDV
jgi:ubiquinone/menaquinone biosynthesis C-methylase UbiE